MGKLNLKLGLIFLLFISHNAIAKNITIISDLDDTIKVTNVSDWSEAVRNAVFSKKAFAEMPMLLEEMESYSNDLYILSASPKILSQRVDSFLEFHKLNPRETFLRGLFGDGDKEEYKTSKVEYVLQNSHNDKLILIGDNVELDPIVYTKIKKAYPDRVATIYIHKVKDKAQLKNTIDYYTAFDIALNEYREGRMSFTEVTRIGTKILFSNNLEKYLPDFVYCPKNESDFSSKIPIILSPMASQIQKKIIKFCNAR